MTGGVRGQGPEARGAWESGIGTQGARIRGRGRRGPGMFDLFYLLDKIKLDMLFLMSLMYCPKLGGAREQFIRPPGAREQLIRPQGSRE